MSAVELLPCPFCGGEPTFIKIGNVHTKMAVTVRCPKCRVERTDATPKAFNNSDHGWLLATAGKNWNKRPAIAPPVAARGGQLQESLVSLYRYKALPHTVTPYGPIMATITEVFESESDNTRIIIESSMGGASLRAEKLSAPVAAGSVDTAAYISALQATVTEQSKRAEKAEAELESWVHTNRVDELQRNYSAALARIMYLEAELRIAQSC